MTEEKQTKPENSSEEVVLSQDEHSNETEVLLTENTEESEINDEISDIKLLTEENEELEDKVLRLQAEIANIQRRNTRERQDAAKYRSQSLASNLLDVLDNLERALEVEVTSEDAIALKTGVEMVHTQFLNAFNSEKIETINPINEEFDPNYHQAVSTMPGEKGQASNLVVEVLQKGYRIDTRVIRPAMVIVSE